MGPENQTIPIVNQTIPQNTTAQPTTTDQTTDEILVPYKDPRNGREFKIPKDLADAFNHQAKLARTSAESKVEEKYKSIMQDYSQKNLSLEELTQKLQQLEDEKLSETDRIKREFERTVKTKDQTLKEWEEKANKNYTLFRDTKIDNDLIGAIQGIGNGIEAANPQQLSLLLKTLGKAELVEENGNYVTKISLTIDGESVQMNPKEAVIKFLSLPENAHHIKNNLRSGGGTSSAGTRTNGNGVAVFTKADMADPIKRKAYLDLSKAGKNPILEQ